MQRSTRCNYTPITKFQLKVALHTVNIINYGKDYAISDLNNRTIINIKSKPFSLNFLPRFTAAL